MSGRKKLLLIFLSIITVLIAVSLWYNYTYSMDEAVAQEVNSPSYTYKLLVATQGSEFKDAITANIINEYKNDSVFIKVIDVSHLPEIIPENYNALVIMHTWENWKPPFEVAQFIDRVGAQDNMIVLTTSGQGDYKMEEVDAITGESELERVDDFTNQIVEKLNILLKL